MVQIFKTFFFFLKTFLNFQKNTRNKNFEIYFVIRKTPKPSDTIYIYYFLRENIYIYAFRRGAGAVPPVNGENGGFSWCWYSKKSRYRRWVKFATFWVTEWESFAQISYHTIKSQVKIRRDWINSDVPVKGLTNNFICAFSLKQQQNWSDLFL